MKTEKKYIITLKYGKIKHFIFPYCNHHEFFARDLGYDYFSQVIESGLLIEGRPHILTCKDRRHAERRKYRNILPAASAKAREVQTLYSYGIIRSGD